MIPYIILFKTITLSWWLTNFSPYQDLLKKYIKPHVPIRLNYLNTALSCFMCYSFWTTLIATQNIFVASAAAMVAFTYDKLMNSLKTFF